MNQSAMKAVAEACRVVGGQSRLAKILNVSTPTVNQWVKGTRDVPPGQCPAIERATDQQVSRKDLRPDDWQKFWPELESESAA